MKDTTDPNLVPLIPPEAMSEFDRMFAAAIQANNVIMDRYNAQYFHPSEPPETWHSIGPVRQVEQEGARVRLIGTGGTLEITFLTQNRLRVRRLIDPSSEPFSWAVIDQSSASVSVSLHETDEQITLRTDSILCVIDRETARLMVCDLLGNVRYAEETGLEWADNKSLRLRLRLATDESAYGTGGRAFPLNLRGRIVALWNRDAGKFTYALDPINYSIPFYVGMHQHGPYGLLWDEPARGLMDIGASDPNILHIETERGAGCYYLFFDDTVTEIVASYTALTGRMPLPPLWTLGYHQCRYSYQSAEELLSVAHELRNRRIPCDALYLDIHYMEGYRVFTWDRVNFPDPKAMTDELHAMGFKVVAILDPGVKVDEAYAICGDGCEENVFLTYPDGELLSAVVWPGNVHFPDFTSARVREWWSRYTASLVKESGLDGLWNDMNEPLHFSGQGAKDLPDYIAHDGEGRGGTHVDLHNVYGMQMSRATLEGLKKARPESRPFNITRSGYAGAQRYASSWTGDNIADWDGLRLSLSMVINLALSGQSFTGADIGGFAYDTTPELLVRWMQANILLPFYRNHSAIDTVRQEPWQFGDIYETYARATIELRYQFLPYLYTAFAQCHFEGLPIIRPLWTAEPNNSNLRSIDDCYLVGDSVLVAPITQEAAIRRTVYLPAGDWYDFWTHTRYEGGSLYTVEAPLTRVPLFIKSGTALPLAPIVQHTSEGWGDTLVLRVYADSGETRIYEDAGDGLAYQKDDYRWTIITCTEGAHSLLIERRTEGTFKPAYRSIEVQMVGASNPPMEVQVDGKLHTTWVYENGVLSVPVTDFKRVYIAT